MNQVQHLNFDVLIIGGGPAGLACAIKLARLNEEKKTNMSICILEKGVQIGAHILSGCILNPLVLNKLMPDWKTQKSPIITAVKKDKFYWFSQNKHYSMPLPPQMNNHGNFIVSLSKVCAWLSEYAQGLGINIFTGYAAKKCVFDKNGNCIGVETGEFGRKKDLSKSAQYQPGIEIHAKQVVLALQITQFYEEVALLCLVQRLLGRFETKLLL